MKKLLFFHLVFIFSFISIHAQIDSTISFIAYWDKGDTKNYKVTKKEVQIKDGIRTKNIITEYNITCTVLDATEDSYTMEWKYENPMLMGIDIPTKYGKEVEKFRLIDAIYLTDEFGIVQEIINWKEIQDLMYEFMERLPNVVPVEDSSMYRQLLIPIKDIYSTKEAIASILLKEIQAFHLPMGMFLPIADTSFYEENLPNLFGGEPIKGNGKLYFQSVDQDNFECKLISTLELDAVDFKNIISRFAESIIENTQFQSNEEKEKAIDEMNKEVSKMKIDIKDYNTFDYVYNPGWPIKVHTKRTMEININNELITRIDEIIIE